VATGPLFVAVDVGTTGARAGAVDLAGRVVAEVRRPYRTRVPRPGWAEQDATDWAEHAVGALGRLPAQVRRRVAAIGLTGQCPTVVPVDADGRPVGPGMLYRDNRATAEAEQMVAALGDAWHARTGHSPEAFHVGPKVIWLRRHAPDVFARTRWFLQPRDVVVHRLTGSFLTDETHANATLFFDLLERRWAPDLFATFDLDPRQFPPAIAPWAVAAPLPDSVARAVGLRAGVPVVIGGGDSQCAAYGAGVVEAGPVSEMSGSSSCLNTSVVKPHTDRRVTHYSHVVPGLLTTEVGLNTTGAAVAWTVRTLGFDGFEQFAAAAWQGRRRLLRTRRADVAPLFLPHLADGERDDPAAYGMLVGLSDRHDRASIAYAVVEGVAAAVVSRVELLCVVPPSELRVAGGGARLDVLGQVKADLLGVPVVHLLTDTTAIGAAMLAAEGAGFGDEAARAIAGTLTNGQRFVPTGRAGDAMAERRRWYRRVRRSRAAHRDEGGAA
jgi:xylulokinase